MDKYKLLDSLKARRNTCDLYAKSYWEKHIVEKEGAKLLEDIIEEVEANREDDMFGIADILNGMKSYCELFQGKCENCFFNITKQVKKESEDYDIAACAYYMIKHNVKDKGSKE